MMAAMLAVYLLFLFGIVRFHIVNFNLFWKASPFIVVLLLDVLLFIPMGNDSRAHLTAAQERGGLRKRSAGAAGGEILGLDHWNGKDPCKKHLLCQAKKSDVFLQ